MSIELLAAAATDLPRIDALSRDVWGYSMLPEHLKWRYFHNPAGDAFITLAVDTAEDRLAGFYGAMPMWLQLGKSRVLGAQVIDTMVHPDFQGKGLFGRMGDDCFRRMADAGVQVLYGFPNANAYHGCVHRLNWHHTGQLRMWVRPCKPWWPGGNAQEGIQRDRPSTDALNNLLQQTMPQDGLNRLVRDGAWLHWRYDAQGVRRIKPDSQRGYHWHALYDGDALKAVCVWGMLDSGDGVLCELHGVSRETEKIVLSDAIHAASHCRFFRCYGYTAPTSLLFKSGFMPVPPRLAPKLIIRQLTPNNHGRSLHLHHSWRIIAGDMDTA